MAELKYLVNVGEKYGRLLILETNILDGSGNSKVRALCDCGNEVIKQRTLVGKGETKSCGCLAVDTSREKFTTHGMFGSSIYRVDRKSVV